MVDDSAPMPMPAQTPAPTRAQAIATGSARGYVWPQWRPGQSGNPRGGHETQRLLRERLRERLAALDDELAAAVERRIAAGSDTVIVRMLDERLGRPRQALDVTLEPSAVYAELMVQALTSLAEADLELPAIEGQATLLPSPAESADT